MKNPGRVLTRYRFELTVALLFLVALAYVMYERRHVRLDGDRFGVAPGEKAACFPFSEVVSGSGRGFCSDSMSICEHQRKSAADDPDYRSVGWCRVVSAQRDDIDAYERDVYIAWGAGLVLAVVLTRRLLGAGRSRDDEWRRSLRQGQG